MKYLNNKHANLRIFLVQVSVVNLQKNIAQKSFKPFSIKQGVKGPCCDNKKYMFIWAEQLHKHWNKQNACHPEKWQQHF